MKQESDRNLLWENWKVIHHVYDGFVECTEYGLKNIVLPKRHFDVLNHVAKQKLFFKGRLRKDDDSLRKAIGNWLYTEEFGAWRNPNKEHPYKANNQYLWQDFQEKSRDYSLEKALKQAGRID